MKTLRLLSVLFVFVSFTISLTAQSGSQTKEKTATVKVLGKCDMCKARIEKTAKTAGATKAAWDNKTSLLTVVYDPAALNIDTLSKKLALKGHDTEKYKATDDDYENLPGCCHYDRSK